MGSPSESCWQEDLRRLMNEADYESAENQCYARLRDHPNEPLCLMTLGQIAQHKGDLRDAVIMYRKATEADPKQIEPWLLLSGALIERGEPEAADTALAMALSLNAGHIEARKLLAHLYMGNDRIAAAAEIYESLLSERVDDRAILEGLGNACRMMGRRESAIESYRNWAALYPEDGNAWWSLANLKNYTFSNDELQQMRDHLALAAGTESQMHFALGQASEDRGEFRISYQHYLQANRLARRLETFMISEHEALIDRLVTFDWTSEPDDGAFSAVPIFIVGMPRSGTTLIEQILASHSAVEGRGELSVLGDLVAELEQSGESYPSILSKLDTLALRELGQRYLAGVGVSSGVFVDKMPNNFLLVGLIKLILPQAKIVHARRHPVANCFSCFKQRFGRGQSYSYDLSELSQYYLQYRRLMDVWQSRYPGTIHNVEYETLVRGPDEVIKGLLDFCGLSFEQPCLDFHATSRVINSASSEQVREPIYQASLDHWRHFEPFLQELIEPLSKLLKE